MAKDNTDKGAESAEMSEAAAILEYLPDAAELLNTEKAESGKVKAEKQDPEAEVESETETETEEVDEAGDDQAEAEEADEEEETEKPAGSEKVQKRIDKLTARAKGAEERAEGAEAKAKELEAEVEKLREAGARVVLAPTAADPLSDVTDANSLRAKFNEALAVKRWCIENPEGGVVKNAKGEEVEIEGAQARRMLADAEEIITVHGPKRERFLTEEAQHDAVARESYPEMFKSGTEAEKAFRSVLEAWPDVVRFPDYKLVIGDYIRGHQARTAKKPEEAGKPSVKRAIAPPVPKVSAQKTTGVTKGPKLEQVLAAGATEDALINYFAA
jgi:hypothetical protein